MKRLFDFIASLLGLMLLSPVLFTVAILIKITSPGPILFRQQRVGKNGQDFVLNKFRTMTVKSGTEKGSFDVGDASRVTAVGAFLRKTKLDEFPQLWDVVLGEMSLVGPRPEIRKWVEAYPERWAVVHSVLPGITDSASIEFRNEEEILNASDDPEKAYHEEVLPKKLSLYEEYVKTRTFFGDIMLIFRTLWVVVVR